MGDGLDGPGLGLLFFKALGCGLDLGLGGFITVWLYHIIYTMFSTENKKNTVLMDAPCQSQVPHPCQTAKNHVKGPFTGTFQLAVVIPKIAHLDLEAAALHAAASSSHHQVFGMIRIRLYKVF